MVVIHVLANLNPFKLVMQNLVLSNSVDKYAFLVSEVVSFLLFSGYLVIVLRYAIAFGMVILLLTHTFVYYWSNLLLQSKSCGTSGRKRTYRIYLQLSCLYLGVRHFLSVYSFGALFGNQIFIVATIWVSIKCVSEIPTIVIIVLGLAGLAAFVVVMRILQMVVLLSQTSEKIIQGMKQGIHRRSYEYFKWRAVRPMYIQCGSQFHISNEAIIKYCEILNTNITNAIFLIPK